MVGRPDRAPAPRGPPRGLRPAGRDQEGRACVPGIGSPLRYLLVVLTHGSSETLAQTLDSFCASVEPEPVEAYLYIDGPDVGDAAVAAIGGRGIAWTVGGESVQHGFCDATCNAWADAIGSEAEADYVFWLENDFRFTRRLDLRDLAGVLDAERRLAQMALVRDAVNEREIAAGGVVASRPGDFQPRDGWLEHRSFFTTNPSLIRLDFMAENPWPGDREPFCEGRYGISLVEKGYSFGYWGAGEEWVEHVGVRAGFGY